MEKSKKIAIPILVMLAALGIGLYGTNSAKAEDGISRTTLMEKIITKFGLDEDAVRQVFDEERQERQAQMEARLEARLDDAISKGELSQEEKKLILDKIEELQNEKAKNSEEHQKLSPEERRAKIQERHDEIKKWADENGIDEKYLFGWRGGHRGFKMGLGR